MNIHILDKYNELGIDFFGNMSWHISLAFVFSSPLLIFEIVSFVNSDVGWKKVAIEFTKYFFVILSVLGFYLLVWFVFIEISQRNFPLIFRLYDISFFVNRIFLLLLFAPLMILLLTSNRPLSSFLRTYLTYSSFDRNDVYKASQVNINPWEILNVNKRMQVLLKIIPVVLFGMIFLPISLFLGLFLIRLVYSTIILILYLKLGFDINDFISSRYYQATRDLRVLPNRLLREANEDLDKVNAEIFENLDRKVRKRNFILVGIGKFLRNLVSSDWWKIFQEFMRGSKSESVLRAISDEKNEAKKIFSDFWKLFKKDPAIEDVFIETLASNNIQETNLFLRFVFSRIILFLNIIHKLSDVINNFFVLLFAAVRLSFAPVFYLLLIIENNSLRLLKNQKI